MSKSLNVHLLMAATSVLENLEKLHLHPADKNGFRGWQNGLGEPAGDALQDSIDALKLAVSESAIESSLKLDTHYFALKPHIFRELVNDLRDLAKQFHGHDSLRERISGRLKKDVQPAEPNTTGLGHIRKPQALAADEADYEANWREFWADIIAPSGEINLDQVKRELSDYSLMLDAVPRVYMHATGGLVSKPLTDPDVVCSLIDEQIQEIAETDSKRLDCLCEEISLKIHDGRLVGVSRAEHGSISGRNSIRADIDAFIAMWESAGAKS